MSGLTFPTIPQVASCTMTRRRAFGSASGMTCIWDQTAARAFWSHTRESTPATLAPTASTTALDLLGATIRRGLQVQTPSIALQSRCTTRQSSISTRCADSPTFNAPAVCAYGPRWSVTATETASMAQTNATVMRVTHPLPHRQTLSHRLRLRQRRCSPQHLRLPLLRRLRWHRPRTHRFRLRCNQRLCPQRRSRQRHWHP